MTKKFRQLSLQAKMSSIFILVNLVVFAVTVILILGINSMSSEIDMVYQGNLRLNELSDRKSTRLNSSHASKSRMPSSA